MATCSVRQWHSWDVKDARCTTWKNYTNAYTKFNVQHRPTALLNYSEDSYGNGYMDNRQKYTVFYCTNTTRTIIVQCIHNRKSQRYFNCINNRHGRSNVKVVTVSARAESRHDISKYLGQIMSKASILYKTYSSTHETAILIRQRRIKMQDPHDRTGTSSLTYYY